jgi:hypothetical protein
MESMDVEKEEKILTTALIMTDWATTRNMSRRYDEHFYERGIIAKHIIGRHPSTKHVDLYFVFRLAAHYAAINYIESSEYRKYYYYLTIIDHGYATANNLNIGLKIKF